jgi:hypothetical protein
VAENKRLFLVRGALGEYLFSQNGVVENAGPTASREFYVCETI